MKDFTIGTILVYPGIGLVKITAERQINGDACWVLETMTNLFNKDSSRASIIVPKKNYEQIGLRRPIRRKEVRKVWEELTKKNFAEALTSLPPCQKGGRYREIIAFSKVEELAGLVVYFFLAQQKKSPKQLLYVAQKYYNKARELLISEIAYASRSKEENVYQKMQKLLKESHPPEERKKKKKKK